MIEFVKTVGQAIAMGVGIMLYAVFVLLVCLLYFSVPVLVVFGTLCALWKLAGRIRAGRRSRR